VKSSSGNQFFTRRDSVLAVIDVQERLIKVMNNRDKLIANLVKLVKFAKIIDLPVVITEQEKLGPTIKEITSEISNFEPIKKIEFSAFKCSQFAEKLSKLSRKNIILAGIETHICITRTALDLLADYNVSVVSDAVTSRTPENRDIGLQRMIQSGVMVTSTEMIIYELLEKAGTAEFKETLGLVK
jgi:nicotinamidase-related amidase